jgi:hypothetical protein
MSFFCSIWTDVDCEIQKVLWLVKARSLEEMVEHFARWWSIRSCDLENLGYMCDGCNSGNGRFHGKLHVGRLYSFQMDG